MTGPRDPQRHESADEYKARILVEANADWELEVLDVPPAQGVVDYAIRRSGLLVGALEVGRNSNPRAIGDAAAAERYAGEPILAPSLQRKWSVSAWSNAPWRQLANRIVDILGRLEAAGRTEFDVGDPAAYRPGTPQFELVSLRVLFAISYPTETAQVDLKPAAGYRSALDPDLAVEHHTTWLASNKKDPSGTRRKLMAHPGPVRHVFVWVDMYGPAAGWRGLWGQLPTRAPQLPAGLTGLWIVGGPAGVFWTAERGWLEVQHRQGADDATARWFPDSRRRHGR